MKFQIFKGAGDAPRSVSRGVEEIEFLNGGAGVLLGKRCWEINLLLSRFL